MQAPGGPQEDTSGGFKYGGWSVGYFDDFMGKIMEKQMAEPFDMLLGRKTYNIFAAHWPNAKNQPGADKLNNAKKYVASTTLTKLDWNNSTLITGDIADEIKQLKKQDGPQIQVHGSSNLIQTLLKKRPSRRTLVEDIPSYRRHGQAPLWRRHQTSRLQTTRKHDLTQRRDNSHIREGRRS